MHRGLGTHVSKVRSIELDASSWAPPLVRLLARLGNEGAAHAWGVGTVTEPTAPRDSKESQIRQKYADRRHVPSGRREYADGGAAVAAAAGRADMHELLCVLVAGATLPVRGEAALLHAAGQGEAGAEAAALLLAWGDDALARDSKGFSLEQVATAAGAPPDGLMVPLLQAAAVRQGNNHAVLFGSPPAPPPPPPVGPELPPPLPPQPAASPVSAAAQIKATAMLSAFAPQLLDEDDKVSISVPEVAMARSSDRVRQGPSAERVAGGWLTGGLAWGRRNR